MFLSYQLRGSYELVPLPVISRAVVTAESCTQPSQLPDTSSQLRTLYICMQLYSSVRWKSKKGNQFTHLGFGISPGSRSQA